MTKKKKKRFKNVDEIIKKYCPKYNKRKRESLVEDETRIGTDLAIQLANEFQNNLQS